MGQNPKKGDLQKHSIDHFHCHFVSHIVMVNANVNKSEGQI